MDFGKKRCQFLLFIVAIWVLSITAEKCRKLVGEKNSSQSAKLTLSDCFDMRTGTLVCALREGIKLYSNDIQAAHMAKARHQAAQQALLDAASQGLPDKAAAKQAKKQGTRAEKVAAREAKRVVGPIFSCGWDFFEALYLGGSVAEGLLRGTGTLVGTFGGSSMGEQRMGRVGYLVGSQVGSWVGGRIGLMIYDVVNGVNVLLLRFPRV